jgi:hypothetical protein
MAEPEQTEIAMVQRLKCAQAQKRSERISVRLRCVTCAAILRVAWLFACGG